MVDISVPVEVGSVVAISPWYVLILFLGVCVTITPVPIFLLFMAEVPACRIKSFSSLPITMLYSVCFIQ